jgi:hypothetical protein
MCRRSGQAFRGLPQDAPTREAREASRSHASDSPMPVEEREPEKPNGEYPEYPASVVRALLIYWDTVLKNGAIALETYQLGNTEKTRWGVDVSREVHDLDFDWGCGKLREYRASRTDADRHKTRTYWIPSSASLFMAA